MLWTTQTDPRDNCSYQQLGPRVRALAKRSFNTKDVIAGQKIEEPEASVEIVKCNSHHHFEAATLQEAAYTNELLCRKGIRAW